MSPHGGDLMLSSAGLRQWCPTGRCWGCCPQWPCGGTRVGRQTPPPTPGPCPPPHSDWRAASSSGRSLGSAAPDTPVSCGRGPAGAAGSSPWKSHNRVSISRSEHLRQTLAVWSIISDTWDCWSCSFGAFEVLVGLSVYLQISLQRVSKRDFLTWMTAFKMTCLSFTKEFINYSETSADRLQTEEQVEDSYVVGGVGRL